MVEEQLSLFQEITREEDLLIERVLLRGSGFAEGKKRILSMYEIGITKAERAKLLSDEYGIGGGASGNLWTEHNARGKVIKLQDEESEMLAFKYERSFTWREVEERIHKLIQEGKYTYERKVI